MRLMTGVYRPTSGTIYIEDIPVFDNPLAKEKIVFVPDDLYFLTGTSLNRMAKMYEALYPRFDTSRFNELVRMFKLNPKVSLTKYSKGMKRQAAIVLALSTRSDYLFFDETFDGLDPEKRNLVRNLIAQDNVDFQTTVVLTSHSLRELEDTCDQLALLHDGKLVVSSDVHHLKTSFFKIQIALKEAFDITTFKEFNVLNCCSPLSSRYRRQH